MKYRLCRIHPQNAGTVESQPCQENLVIHASTNRRAPSFPKIKTQANAPSLSPRCESLLWCGVTQEEGKKSILAREKKRPAQPLADNSSQEMRKSRQPRPCAIRNPNESPPSAKKGIFSTDRHGLLLRIPNPRGLFGTLWTTNSGAAYFF